MVLMMSYAHGPIEEEGYKSGKLEFLGVIFKFLTLRSMEIKHFNYIFYSLIIIVFS